MGTFKSWFQLLEIYEILCFKLLQTRIRLITQNLSKFAHAWPSGSSPKGSLSHINCHSAGVLNHHELSVPALKYIASQFAPAKHNPKPFSGQPYIKFTRKCHAGKQPARWKYLISATSKHDQAGQVFSSLSPTPSKHFPQNCPRTRCLVYHLQTT